MRKAQNVWHKVLLFGLERIGLFYSIYRGIVISTNDPLNMGRLQIQVPSVDGKYVDPTWVPCKGIYGGKDYGVHFLPLAGDLVWVEYTYGKPSNPVWSHYGWGQNEDGTSEKPEEFASANIYGFKTPLGQLVTIKDGIHNADGEYSGAEITIKTREGKKIFISEAGGIQIDATESGNIELRAGVGVVELSEQGISMTTGDKPVWINGSNKVLYAKSEFATKIQTFDDIGISETTRVGL